MPLELLHTRAAGKERLLLWVRLLRVVRVVEAELRERLKREFDSTLPRFDVLSALYRERDGMLMSDLSRFLLVSNGNVTGIVERLVGDGLVRRDARPDDRRAFNVRLTPAGITRFEAMAAAHESWITELLSAIDETDAYELSAMLKAFRSNWEDEH